MRSAVLLSMLAMLGTLAPALAVEETAEGFSAAMQGCWNRTSPAALSSQMCLSGGIEGALVITDCSTNANLTECGRMDGTYALKDEKFWRSYGEGGPLTGGLDNCDVRIGPGQKFELHNCAWTTVPEFSRTINDGVYEKAVNQ